MRATERLMTGLLACENRLASITGCLRAVDLPQSAAIIRPVSANVSRVSMTVMTGKRPGAAPQASRLTRRRPALIIGPDINASTGF
jgi:hypothetical protein